MDVGKTMVAAVLVCTMVLPAIAKKRKADAALADQPKVERSYQAYKTVRDAAKAAYDSGDFAGAVRLYLDAAALTPDKWVEAWQLNNAASAILKAAVKDVHGNPEAAAAERALNLLKRAEEIARVNPAPEGKPDASVTISKNRLYCECVLGIAAW